MPGNTALIYGPAHLRGLHQHMGMSRWTREGTMGAGGLGTQVSEIHDELKIVIKKIAWLFANFKKDNFLIHMCVYVNKS